MSDFEEGFATGLLLGRKQGGGYRSDVFRDILDNSEAWLNAPIDDKFKYTASIWYSERLDVYDSGYLSPYDGTDSDGTVYFSFSPRYRKNFYTILTAWENDTPLFANLAEWNTYTRMTGESDIGANYYDENNISRKYYFTTPVYTYIRGTASFGGDVLSYDFDSYGVYRHSISVPIIRAVCNKKTYRAVNENTDSEPQIELVSDEDVTVDSRWGDSIYTIPFYEGTFADISDAEIKSKYTEIVKAIYTANGKLFRNSRIMP